MEKECSGSSSFIRLVSTWLKRNSIQRKFERKEDEEEEEEDDEKKKKTLLPGESDGMLGEWYPQQGTRGIEK